MGERPGGGRKNAGLLGAIAAVDFHRARLDRGFDDQFRAVEAAIHEGAQRGRDIVGAGKFLGQDESVLDRKSRSRRHVRGRGMGRVADQDDPALVPRVGQQEPFERAVIGLRIGPEPGADRGDMPPERRHQFGQMLDVSLGCEPRVARDMLEQEDVHLVLRDRRHADLERPAEIDFGAVDFGRAIGDDPPAALVGKLRPRRIGKDHRAHLGENAIGTDDQVKAFDRAVGQRDIDAVLVLLERVDRDPEADVDAHCTDALRQDVVEHRAHDPAAMHYRR